MKRIALLTGGGDAPGLNGILESVTKALLRAGTEVVGIEDGFEGIFGRRARAIRLPDVDGIHCQAGTLLGTSNKSRTEGREAEFTERFKELQTDGIIVAGGDGTFAALKPFEKQIPIIGVPKTIDNDLAGTEITFGYDTACSVVAEAVDALRATADAHRRIIVVETMGRTAGWIALGGGLASYADAVLLPEAPFSRSELLEHVRELKRSGKRGLIIVASEGAHAEGEDPSVAFKVPDSPQQERYGGIAQALSAWLERETGWESRHVVLGHLQRAKYPTTTDRFLTLAMGVEASRMALEGAWGQAVVYRNGRITRAPISDLMAPARLVSTSHRWVLLAEEVGIFMGRRTLRNQRT